MANAIPEGFGATYLNPKIESYADLVFFVKSLLGYPAQNIELTDTQWALFIDEAVSTFTQFEGNRKEEYLVFCANLYHKGCGVKLDDLVSIGCNDQYCYQTVLTQTVTSTDIQCQPCGTFTAYLSVTPFAYPTSFNYLDPYSVPFSGLSGQFLYLDFDPENPWDMECVCDADCVTINPVGSEWYNLSTNPCLSGTIFNFNDPSISDLVSEINYFIGNFPLSAVPLTGLGAGLSAIPIDYYDVQCFYPPNENVGPPVEACINIGHGAGFVYPNCDTSKINYCSALSAQYNISPTWNYILTCLNISSVDISVTALNYPDISSYFVNFCDSCFCNCQFLSTFHLETSSFHYSLCRPVLSGTDGMIYDLSGRDVSSATHLKLFNVPSCTTDGSIPLNSNDGIVGTFTLCNSALSTNGPKKLKKVQFFKDHKPPVESLYQNICDWENNGFTMTYYNSAYGDCIRTTPEPVKVNVDFCKKNLITNIGTVSTFLSSDVDSGINRKRKVLGVFDIEFGNSAGYAGYGGDLLFNFDYALMANTFGYDLQGGRSYNSQQGYDLLTYHMAKSFVEMSRKMLRNISYRFDPKTQFLKITPEPPIRLMADSVNPQLAGCCGAANSNNFDAGQQCYLVGVYLEPTVQECLSEYWIREWVLARAMWTLGRIRGKYQQVTLIDGSIITGDVLLTEGKDRMEKLMTELRDEYRHGNAPPVFFIG